ncbi:MAG: PKD domain-containing protein, partial [Methanomicrobiales archaeon]|nr:PKD domain-containing protein [Methanomicrobiales archaeon]
MARKSRSTPRAVLFLFIAALSLLVGTAGAAPEAAFISNVTGGPAPLTVQFNDTSTGDPDGWAWYFGDETYGGEWTCVNTSSGWTARTSHTSVALPDGSILLIGGEDDSDRLNDTWRSADGGVIWELVNASSGWTERIYHTCVALPDGNIILMGGYDHIGEWLGGPKNDIWQSVDGGATWTCVNASSRWMERNRHASVVMPDGSIVLMGGMFASPWWCLNDTWRSTDGGITWICMNESSGWMARSGHTTVALPDGSILLMGGIGGVGAGAANTFLNDIWKSTDGGEHWALVNANSGWTARTGHTTVALADGSIVLMGGLDREMNHLNDTWRSTDGGMTWMQLPDAGWTARVDHTSVTMPDGSVILMGGFDAGGSARNDTWCFQLAGSSHQNPTHTYTEPGTYSVTLQAYNDDGHNITQKVAYITVTLPAPEAKFSATPLSGTAPLTMKFTDQSTNNPTTWKWDFGDGETSTEENPTHTYAVPGTYTVTLTVWNGGGSNTHTDSITVTPPPPEAGFTASMTSGTAPLTVQFTDTSTGDPDGWAWYFGDETYGGEWTNQIDAAGWEGRRYPAAVTMPNGNIIFTGGMNNSTTYLNDTWRSTDNGKTWENITPQDPDAIWSGRRGHAAVSIGDSIVLMGGHGHGYSNSIWRSTDEGATWTQVAEHAEWSARWEHTSVVMP